MICWDKPIQTDQGAPAKLVSLENDAAVVAFFDPKNNEWDMWTFSLIGKPTTFQGVQLVNVPEERRVRRWVYDYRNLGESLFVCSPLERGEDGYMLLGLFDLIIVDNKLVRVEVVNE